MMQSMNKCDRPFPRRCPECGKVEVHLAVIAYDAQINHDGRVYSFRIPQLHVNKCAACGDVLFDNLTDDEVSQALREHLHLLLPREIREKLHILGLSQKEFGKQTGVAPETISRWLHGRHIQSRAMDNLMRMFFEREEAKHRALESAKGILREGEPTPSATCDGVTAATGNQV